MWSVCVVSYSITYFVCGDPPSLSLTHTHTHIDVSPLSPLYFLSTRTVFDYVRKILPSLNQPLGDWDVSKVTSMGSVSDVECVCGVV